MMRFSAGALLLAITARRADGAVALRWAVGGGPVQPIPSAWNDTACHEPSDPGCNTCCELELPPGGAETAAGQWVAQTWAGNCTGCVEGAPCEPHDCPCGDCFPGVKPWWNEMTVLPNGAPADCKACSRCKVRAMTDYREVMFGVCGHGDDGDPLCKPDKSCDCTQAVPPVEGECEAPAAGVNSCNCWCDYNSQMKNWCGLDPDPTVFPGPCAYDRQVAQSRNQEFAAECDDAGYYKLVQCGPKAPPALPPSPPGSGSGFELRSTAGHRSLLSTSRPTDAASVAAAAAGDSCWCAEPSYGIMNGTTAVTKASGAVPDCVHTLQCALLNIQECAIIGATFCNWTVIAMSNGTWCAPIMGGPTGGR